MGDDGLGKNLTGCSGHDLLFSFNPSRVLQHESGNDTNLGDLGWPTAISDDFKTFSITNQAMGVLYVIGAGIAGIAMLIRLGLLITRRSRQSIFEVASLLVGYPYIIHIYGMFEYVFRMLTGQLDWIYLPRNRLDHRDGSRLPIRPPGQRPRPRIQRDSKIWRTVSEHVVGQRWTDACGQHHQLSLFVGGSSSESWLCSTNRARRRSSSLPRGGRDGRAEDTGRFRVGSDVESVEADCMSSIGLFPKRKK